MSHHLDPAGEPGAELARAVHDRLTQTIAATSNRRLSTKERIHAARTSTKKMRAALQLVRTQERKHCHREIRALGDAARDLSALRDADTMVDTFDAVLKHYAVPRKKFASVRVALLAHRRAVMPTRASVERRLRTFVARLREVQRRLHDWEPDTRFAALAGDFSRSYHRARRACAAVEKEPSAKTYHQWRIATKRYFYQCRLLRAAWPPAMKALAAELRELSSHLGDEHDLSVLRTHLRKLFREDRLEVEDDTARAMLGLLSSRRDELRAAAIPLGERLFADKRRAVEARMVRWWEVARAQPTTPLAA